MRCALSISFIFIAMKQTLLSLIFLLLSIGHAQTVYSQEPTVLKKEDLPPAMLPEKIPPTADSIAAFRRIKPGMSMKDVVEICGLPAKDIGSGIYVYIYELPDQSKVRVGTSDGKQLWYVVHVLPSGEEREIIRNLAREKKPQPSARRRSKKQ